MKNLAVYAKAILGAVLAFAAAVIATLPQGGPINLDQWLIAVVAGLVTALGVGSTRNAELVPLEKMVVGLVEQILSKRAGTSVAAEGKPSPVTVNVAPATVKPAYAGPVPPLNPAPLVSFVDPIDHAQAAVPVSEPAPVGATAVSATP